MPQWTATGTESALNKKKKKIMRTLLIENPINRLIIIIIRKAASRITMRIDLKW